MDDDVVEAPCTLESCSNLRNNLKTLLMQTKRQAHELQNYSKVQAEVEVLRMKLVSTEATLQDSTSKMYEAVNSKEIAEAELKQTQSNTEYYRKKVAMLQEQADEAEKHKEQAIQWREKYDSMGALAEKLESNNIDIKSKYEATVKTLEAVGKKTLSLQNQVTQLKTTKNDQTQKTKKLDKYLKSAIQVIDSLSTTSNLSKQSKTIKDLVNVFRRDDVRLFFNSQPWKNSMSSGASTSVAGAEAQDDSIDDVADDHLPSESNDDDLLQLGRHRLSDEEDEYVNEDDDEDEDGEIEKLESMLTKRAAEKPKRPDFVPKMMALKAKKDAPRLFETKIVRKWPDGLRKPTATDSGSLLNPKSVHSKQIPTCDFDAIAQATEKRKKELLGRPSEVSTSTSTIHGKKGKTVREQQSEMMKGESVKKKVARMRAEAEAKKTSSASPEVRVVAVAPVVSAAPAAPKEPERVEPIAPRRSRYQSFMMSEMDSDESDAHDPDEQVTSTQEESRRPGRRPRSTSTPPPKRVKTCPSEVMQPLIPIRRSSRIAGEPVEMAPPKLEISNYPKGRPRAVSCKSVDLTVEVAPQQPETPKKPRGRPRSISYKRDTLENTESAPSQPEVSMNTRGRPRGISCKRDTIEKGRPRAISCKRDSIETTENASSETEAARNPRRQATDLPREASFKSTSKCSTPTPSVTVVNEPSMPRGNQDVIETQPVQKSTVKPKEIVEEEEEEMEIQLPPVKVIPIENQKVGDVLKRRIREEAKKLAVPTPITSEAPTKEHEVQETTNSEEPATSESQEFGDISTSRNESDVVMPSKESEEVPRDQESEYVEKETNYDVEFDHPSYRAPGGVDSQEVQKTLEQVENNASEASEAHSSNIQDTIQKVIDDHEKVPENSEATDDVPSESKVVVAPEPIQEVIDVHEKVPEDSEVSEVTEDVPRESEVVKIQKPLEVVVAPEPIQEVTDDHEKINEDSEVTEDESREAELPQSPISLKPSVSIRPQTPKSPKEILVSLYGLDVSDSEDELEEQHMQIVEESEKKMTSEVANAPDDVAKKTVASSESQESTSEVSISQEPQEDLHPKAPTAPEAPAFLVLELTPPTSEDTSEGNSDLLDDILSGAKIVSTPTKSAPKLTTSKPPHPAPKPIISKPPTEVQKPSAPKEDDLMMDILSDAKTTAQKSQKRTLVKTTDPVVPKRPTPPIITQKRPAVTRKASAPNGMKRQAPPTSDDPKSSEPQAKCQNSQKAGIQISDPVPLKRGRPPSVNRSKTTDAPSTSSEATTSAKKPGPTKTILIEVPRRPRGRSIKMEQKPIGMKEMMAKNAEKGGKRVDKIKGHFRQALDLKVAINELKRPMEEKGIILGDSLPLTPSDAVDVMMEFLRESTAVDQWAVLNRQRINGDLTPLLNKEEENFLQVSTSLIEEYQKLLQLFIIRILQEIALRDCIDTQQCGRLIRLFCHAVRFAEVVPTPSENADDVPDAALVSEKKSTWMHRLFMVLLHKHPTQLVKSIAYCLISEVAEYCQFLADEMDKDPATSEFHVAFRILMHKDSEQSGVITWLFNSKFQLGFLDQPTPEDIRKAFHMAHQKFVAGDSDLKKSIYLSKTAAPEVLEVAFHMLKNQMTQIEQQFLEPKEKDKELKHKTAFTAPSVAAKMTPEEAEIFKKESEWQKTVLLIMIDNPTSTHWNSIMNALKQISHQIVSFREIIESSEVEQFVEPSGVEPIRESVQHLMDLISEFTKFPLKPSILPSSSTSTSHNSVPSTSSSN